MAVTVTQDPNAHLFWEVDWSKWLAARGYNADDILSVAWTVPTTITKTQEVRDGTVARIYVKAPERGKKSAVTCTLEVSNKDGGMETVKDDYTFFILGQAT